MVSVRFFMLHPAGSAVIWDYAPTARWHKWCQFIFSPTSPHLATPINSIRESPRVFRHFSTIWEKPDDRLRSFPFERVANEAKIVSFLPENENFSNRLL